MLKYVPTSLPETPYSKLHTAHFELLLRPYPPPHFQPSCTRHLCLEVLQIFTFNFAPLKGPVKYSLFMHTLYGRQQRNTTVITSFFGIRVR